jgi:putative spermidine/putrescine transport system substrate-binding protein
MSGLDEREFDPHEYADQLGYTDELGKGDYSDPNVVRAVTPEERRRTMSRRELLVKGGIGAAAIAGAGSLVGTAAAKVGRAAKPGAYTGTLNVISLGVEWPAGAQAQAEKDLGVKFNVQLLGTNAQVQKSITAADSFDIGGLYNYQMFPIWPTGNFQPVEVGKLTAWKDFYPVFTKGRVNPADKAATFGQGDASFRVNFVDPQGSANGIGKSTGLPLTKEGPTTNQHIVQWWDESANAPYKGKPMPPYVLGGIAHFNMDSLGYNGDVINKEPGKVQWGELLNPAWKGKVALLNDPAIAMQDAGNAVTDLGLMKFKDIGNMTIPEIDRLIKIMIAYKKKGQFRAFWTTFNESVNLMSSKEVVIESMWSPAVALLVAQGVPVRYAFPSRGMRGWVGTQAIPTHVTGDKLDAVYNYINWTNEGFLGALIMRQGYYVANGKTLPAWLKGPKAAEGKPPFTMAEYDFWYNGKPAASDLPGITGHVGDVKKGQVRDGGSFINRSKHYASWNSFFKNNVYQVKRFNDFLSA